MSLLVVGSQYLRPDVVGTDSASKVLFTAQVPLAKDYKRKAQTSETLVEVSMMRLMLKRLAREHEQPCRDRYGHLGSLSLVRSPAQDAGDTVCR